jgi:hypothetical protein
MQRRWEKRFSKLLVSFQTGIKMKRKIFSDSELRNMEEELQHAVEVVNADIRKHLALRQQHKHPILQH